MVHRAERARRAERLPGRPHGVRPRNRQLQRRRRRHGAVRRAVAPHAAVRLPRAHPRRRRRRLAAHLRGARARTTSAPTPRFGVSGLGGNPAYPPGADPPLPPLPIGRAGLLVARAHARLGWHWWPDTNAILSAPYDGRHAACSAARASRAAARARRRRPTSPTGRRRSRAAARLVTGARVRRLVTDGRGRVSGAEWIDRDGREHLQTADLVLCAANGIGTARLLLASASAAQPDGLANSSGLVGRRLMMHPLTTVLAVFDEELESWQGQKGSSIQSLEFYLTDESTRLRPRCAVGPRRRGRSARRRARERWHVGCRPPSRDARTVRAHRHVDPPRRGPARRSQPRRAVGDAGRLVGHRRAEGRVPARRQHARHDRLERRARARIPRRSRRRRTEVDARPANGHFMGTARMGTDPRTSVVDPWGMAHDVANLGIVDGSSS